MFTRIMIFLFLLSSSIYITKKPGVIYRKCSKEISRFNSLRTLISTTEKRSGMVYWISIKMIFKLSYNKLRCCFITSPVKKVGNNTYEVSYEINNICYKMLVQPFRGPRPVMQITDDNSNDITEHILPYMGPRYDWHCFRDNNTLFNPPSYFNHEYMTFEMSDCTTQTLHLNGDRTDS